MKKGKTLTELAVELDRQVKSKKDYLADTRNLSISEDGVLLKMEGRDGNSQLGINDLCHNQIAGRVGIPTKYYNRMRVEAPNLLSRNVNHWFAYKPEKRMIRTIDGKARAFLSNRFRPLDNYDLVEAVLPTIQEMGCTIQSAELTESRLYIKAVTEKIEVEIKKGDIVQAGIVISNSEVGLGSVKVEPMIYRLICDNGAIMNDYGMRKYHVGKGFGDEDINDVSMFFKDETKAASDKAFWMKVKDVVEGSLSKVKFDVIIDKLKAATEKKIEVDPITVVERTKIRFGLSDDEKGSVLKHLINGGDLSSYGLHNAVTKMSQSVENYDRATELERAGGTIIQLSDKEWNEIANTI